jgi:hypothetical protein
MPKEKVKTFLGKARSWASKRGLFGPQAFLRYVILTYLDSLTKISSDFVFKGGNLLWLYIETPRATVDLDLATITATNHKAVKESLAQACQNVDGIKFSILKFEEVESEGKLGAAVVIGYKTDQGASNSFGIDVVYQLETDTREIPSPLTADLKILAASLENIIADKLAAAHRFGGGNTRMKDYDDLWRLSRTDIKLNARVLKKLLSKREISPQLDAAWINAVTQQAWKDHQKRYKDLPASLEDLFREVNFWLDKIL